MDVIPKSCRRLLPSFFLIGLLAPFRVIIEKFIPELVLHRVGDTHRHCFTVRVPQDHEYVPCEKPYGNDTYTKCPNYTYQPDSASSSFEPHCIDPSCSPEYTRVKEISKDGKRILRCVCDLNKKYCGTNGNDCKKINESSCVGKISQDCSCIAPENGLGRLGKWPETNWSLPKQQGDPLKQKEETSANSPYWVGIAVFVCVCCCSLIWYNRKTITKTMRSGLKRNRSVQLTAIYGRMQCEHTNERLSEENKTENDRNIDRSVLHCNANSNGMRNVLVSQNYVSQSGGSAKTAIKPVAKVFPQRITTQPMHLAEHRHQESLQTDVQSIPPFDNVDSLHLSSLNGDPVTQN